MSAIDRPLLPLAGLLLSVLLLVAPGQAALAFDNPPSQNGSPPAPPQLDRLPQPAGRPHQQLDLEAIANGYAPAAIPDELSSGPRLWVLVSLDLPAGSLRRLLQQAGRAHVALTLRGFQAGSLRKTVAAIQRLAGRSPVNIQIDPRPFDRFDIQQVPSFVLSTASEPACTAGRCATPAANDTYIKTAGDVTLDYALQYMRREAPEYAADLDRYLQRLEP